MPKSSKQNKSKKSTKKVVPAYNISNVKSGPVNITRAGKPGKFEEFKTSKRIDRNEIKNMLKDKIATLDKNTTYYFSGCYNKTGFRCGKSFTVDNYNLDDAIYDFDDQYNTQNVVQDAQYFLLYSFKNPSKKGGDSDGYLNDCLWKALRDAFKYDMSKFPKEIKSKVGLKEYLGLERNDKISYKLVRDKIVPLLKDNNISLQLYGDYKITTEILDTNIDIILKHGHYSVSIDENENEDKLIELRKKLLKDKEMCKYIQRKDQIFTYYLDNQNSNDIKYFKYNGKKLEEIDRFKLFKKMRYHTAIECTKDDYKQKHEEYIAMVDELLTVTKGKINLYQFRNLRSCSFHFFTELIKDKNFIIEDLDPLEQDWLHQYFSVGGGAHIYCEPYEGYATTLDINSAYASGLNSSMTIPLNRPTFRKVKLTDFKFIVDDRKNTKFYNFEYGIYKCKVEFDESKKKVFKFKNNNLYSHYDLNLAQKIGLKIELIDDSEVNSMIYDRTKLIFSNKMFSEYVNYFYDLKCKGIKGAKAFLNVLYGSMCRKNKLRAKSSKKSILNLEANDKVLNIYKLGNNETLVEYMKPDNVFMYPTARISIFLCSKNRTKLQEFVLPIQKNVVKIHTDSITINDKSLLNQFIISNRLGDYKIENENANAKIIKLL